LQFFREKCSHIQENPIKISKKKDKKPESDDELPISQKK
jgi:hypothetical protein